MTLERIYLDNAATTPVRSEVVDAMAPHWSQVAYNPSSIHAEGRGSKAALDAARESVARSLGAARKEIVFTGSGSEADNLALLGVARALRGRGRHLVSTRIEHHAVLHALDHLAAEGWDVTLLDVDSDGLVDLHDFTSALRDDTVLASVMYANNEIGVVQPLPALAAAARARGVLFHTDAVQAPGYLPVGVESLGVDLLSVSAHKFYGPKGVGVLYVRTGTPLEPIVHGGGQEFGRRSGTENLPGAVGLARALELAVAEQPANAERLTALRDHLERRLQAQLGGIRINGAGAPRLPHHLNVSFAGVESEALLVRLDLEGIAVSSGSACTSGILEPSHVIAALGLPEEWMRGVIRFTLGRTTTQDDVDRVAAVVTRVVSDFRTLSHAPT